MNVGIVVEGQNDLVAYLRLIQRIRNDITGCQLRPCGGKSRLKNGFVNFLREFQRNPAWQIDVALVIRDSDCSSPQPIEDQLQDVLGVSGFTPQFPVEFFAIPCMLESWLLGDLGAFPTLAAQRGHGVGMGPPNIQIANSNSSGDKDAFLQVLSHFMLPATPAVYGEVAALANLALIGNRCTYFREFMRRIRAV
jgi:hypothetical protein